MNVDGAICCRLSTSSTRRPAMRAIQNNRWRTSFVTSLQRFRLRHNQSSPLPKSTTRPAPCGGAAGRPAVTQKRAAQVGATRRRRSAARNGRPCAGRGGGLLSARAFAETRTVAGRYDRGCSQLSKKLPRALDRLDVVHAAAIPIRAEPNTTRAARWLSRLGIA
jgi:hypothetical protein